MYGFNIVNEEIFIMEKKELLRIFRCEANKVLKLIVNINDKKANTKTINTSIKRYADKLINEVKNTCSDKESLLDSILMITYISYVVMLEYRNKLWPYNNLDFSRRIGELWEPFCKLSFEYSINHLTIIDPLEYHVVKKYIVDDMIKCVSLLDIDNDIKDKIIKSYEVPWNIIDSCDISLSLDLHFKQNNINYNCDFKSGFNSNEKGNTNRLLQVGSIYKELDKSEVNILFVRQSELVNNNYLKKLSESKYWDVYCGNDCYEKMKEFTGIDVKEWINKNIDWENDISQEFYLYLEENELLKYFLW